MFLGKNLTGRSEKRLSVTVPVRLSAFAAGSGEVEEKTYTDNLSSRGVRVCTMRSWRPRDQVEVDPVDQGPPMRGEVVYCEKFDDARSFLHWLQVPSGTRLLEHFAEVGRGTEVA